MYVLSSQFSILSSQFSVLMRAKKHCVQQQDNTMQSRSRVGRERERGGGGAVTDLAYEVHFLLHTNILVFACVVKLDSNDEKTIKTLPCGHHQVQVGTAFAQELL
jgi:hypothetical protein